MFPSRKHAFSLELKQKYCRNSCFFFSVDNVDVFLWHEIGNSVFISTINSIGEEIKKLFLTHCTVKNVVLNFTNFARICRFIHSDLCVNLTRSKNANKRHTNNMLKIGTKI